MNADAGGGPVATATADLVSWFSGAAGAPVRIGPPDAADREADPALSVWPLDLRADQETCGARQREPLRLRVRYLVCASGAPDPAIDLIDRVLVAAATAGRPTVVFDPPSPQTWPAFGAAPQVAVMLDVPVQIARPDEIAPLVRQPLRVESVPLRPLHGQLVGPGDVPLAGMRVEVVSAGAGVYTDARGRFAFAAVPATSARLRLNGRGRQLFAQVETTSAEPVVIHCDFEES